MKIELSSGEAGLLIAVLSVDTVANHDQRARLVSKIVAQVESQITAKVDAEEEWDRLHPGGKPCGMDHCSCMQ